MEKDEPEQWQQKLPTFDGLVQRFSLFSASPTCNTEIGYGGSLNCNCEGCSEWHAFVQGKSPDCKEVQYEVLNSEHVKGLAHYLIARAAEYELPLMKVLEVGAGSGRLCHYLTYYLAETHLASQVCVVQLTATDSGERGLNGPNIFKQDAIEAISEVMPHVVVISWMPIGVDWTAHIRATSSVLEYILIGETDVGICGDPWLTWGYTESGDSTSDISSEDPDSPCSMTSKARNLSEFPSKTNSFSISELGRQVDTVHVENNTHLFQTNGENYSFSEISQPTVARSEENVKDNISNAQRQSMIVGTAQSARRHQLCRKKTLHKSCKPEEWSGGGGMSPQSLAGGDNRHENLGIQSLSDGHIANLSEIPPYAIDGWVKIEIVSLSAVQICRTDERWSTHRHSRTVSFRRCFLPCHRLLNP